MTTAKTVPNIILGEGDGAVTIYTTKCERIRNKILNLITPAQTKANWSSGPKITKVVDLLRVETRFAVMGFFDSVDESKIDALFEQGGVINLSWKDQDYSVNIEKYTITDDNTQEQDESTVQFTAVVGGNV